MNTYVFNEIKVGMSAAFNVVVTEEMQDNFLKLSGDNNPMHVDCEYATLSGFKDRDDYGMLTSAFYSRLAGVYLPGRNCLLQECKISFNKPVYIGDKLKVYGEVVEVNDMFQRITVKAYIQNEKGVKVSKAKIIAGVLNHEW